MNRPQSMQAERSLTFKAWRNNRPVTNAPGLALALTPREAIDAVLPGSGHKTVVRVLQDDAGSGERLLFTYAIKQESKAQVRRNPVTGQLENTRRLYPELVDVLAVVSFEPVPPFDALTDDPVGRDPQLVEAK